MHLPGGLSGTLADRFGILLTEIHGANFDSLPTLAAALLFSAPSVQDQLRMPEASDGHLLIHDYQSVAFSGPVPTDTPLDARVETRREDGFAEYSFSLAGPDGPVAMLTTALRIVSRADIAAAKPAILRPEALRGAAWSDTLHITQAQTDTYLDLSGDQNPIHRADGPAQSYGLPGPVVPGLLLAALADPQLHATQPDSRIATLKARFLSALTVDDPFRIGLQPRGPGKARACLLGADDRSIALIDLILAA